MPSAISSAGVAPLLETIAIAAAAIVGTNPSSLKRVSASARSTRTVVS